jgi:hypothetical protein
MWKVERFRAIGTDESDLLVRGFYEMAALFYGLTAIAVDEAVKIVSRARKRLKAT